MELSLVDDKLNLRLMEIVIFETYLMLTLAWVIVFIILIEIPKGIIK